MITRILAALSVLAFHAVAYADLIPGYYSAPGMDTRRDYLNQHFSEHIDPFTGKLQLHYKDLVLPGNGGFDLTIQRSYTNIEYTQREAGNLMLLGSRTPWGVGWTMHFGRVLRASNSACNRGSLIDMTDNPVLELPDGSRQVLFDAQTVNPSGPLYLTMERWKADCATDGSLGLVVTSSEGMVYEMTVREIRPMGTFTEYAWHVSRIADPNGNTMNFTYVTNPVNYVLLKSISTSDGRSVTFTYTDENTADARLTSVSSGGRTWTYSYVPAPGLPFRYFLTQVTRPSGGGWSYQYNGDLGTSTAGSYSLNLLTYPTNGTIAYTYEFTEFDLADPSNDAVTVATKVADGGTWTFDYFPGASFDLTRVTTPIGELTYQHHGYSAATNGTVWKIGLPLQKTVGSLQTETYTWDAQVISNENYRRADIFTLKQDVGSRAPIMTGQTITRDGTAYSTTYSNFDSFGNPARAVESGNASRTTDYTYFVNTSKWIINRVADETIVGIGTIDRTFDANNGNLTRLNRYGVITDYTYLATSDLATMRNARLNVWTYSNYFRGVARTEQHPEAVTITRTVDNFGNILTERNGEGHLTTYGYDGIDRVTSIAFPIGSPVSITWGTTTRAVTRGTYSESTSFDGYARPTSITREGITTTATYNRLGQRTFESYPGSPSGTTFTWDMLDRMTRATHPGGSFKAFAYLSANRSRVTDERGHITTYTYRSFGDPDQRDLMQIAAPVAAASITMTRNLLGQLTGATQNLKTRTFAYDTRFFLTGITHPETGTTVLGRDAVGNKISRQVGTSAVVTYDYDGLNRMIRINYPAGTSSVTQTWNRNGKLTSVSNGVVRSYAYDANNNLTGETLTLGSLVLPVGYAIDALDHLSSITYPSGQVVDYAPDDLGRPTRVGPFATSVTHHPSGQVGSVVYANGVTTTTTLNPRLWPTTFRAVRSAATLVDVTYGYDNAANLTSVTDAIVASNNRTLGYDPINRLTSAQGSWGTGTIAYDGDGDIASQTLGSSTVSYTYDSTNNRLTSVSSTPTVNIVSVTITPGVPQGTYVITVQTSAPHNLQRHHVINVSGMNATGSYNLNGVRSVASVIDATRFRILLKLGGKGGPTGSYVSGGTLSRGYAFSYDAYGNVTSDGARTFTYDDAPVLRCANCALNPYRYEYDGRNTLVGWQAGQLGYQHRLYASNGDLLAEYGLGGAPVREYAYLYGQLVASVTGGVATTYHVDPVGSPIAATDQAGAVLWRESYFPYGERTGDLATSNSPLGFAGEFQERSTGLSDFGARHYDSFIGRFMAVDAEEFSGDSLLGFNRYAYANNNPYRFVDPDGNSAISKAIKLVLKGGDVSATFADAIQDVSTVLNPAATPWQRIWAGASLLSELAPVSVSDFKDVGRVIDFAASQSRKGRQARLRELGKDPKVSSADRGWIRNEQRQIAQGNRDSIRNPPGKDLAHERGREAAKGYDYGHTSLQDRDLHRLQHKYDDFGRKNAERPLK